MTADLPDPTVPEILARASAVPDPYEGRESGCNEDAWTRESAATLAAMDAAADAARERTKRLEAQARQVMKGTP